MLIVLPKDHFFLTSPGKLSMKGSAWLVVVIVASLQEGTQPGALTLTVGRSNQTTKADNGVGHPNHSTEQNLGVSVVPVWGH